MLKRTLKTVLVLAAVLSFFPACQGKSEKGAAPAGPAAVAKVSRPSDNAAKAADNAAKPPAAAGEAVEIEVQAALEGKPAAGAAVTVGGAPAGTTDEKGYFLGTQRKRPGEEVEVAVSLEKPGLRVTPWKGSFVVKLPREGKADRYSFKAELSAASTVTFNVREKGAPVAGAAVSVNGKKAGETGADGAFVYEFKAEPRKGFEFAVAKPGFGTWARSARKVAPGTVYDVALSKRSQVSVVCLTDDYGQTRGVAGIAVSVDGKTAGKTDARGRFEYKYAGKAGKKAKIALAAPGYLPDVWEGRVVLEGEVEIRRFFYSAAPRPVRVGVYGFVGNTPGEDMRDAVDRAQREVAAQLFKSSAFREVPAADLRGAMKRARLSVEKATSRGWKGTPLAGAVDVIALGSVARDDRGYLVETKFHGPDGKPFLSLIERAKSAEDISRAAKEIATGAVDRFPFEGTVVAVEDGRYRINLGKSGYRIGRGTEFDASAPKLDKAGRVAGYRPSGILKARKVDETGSWAEVEELKGQEAIAPGTRVVRYVPREGEEGGAQNTAVLAVSGGVPPNVAPLSGVNVYLNGEWVGSTGPDGQATVSVRLGKSYSLLLYKHGYRQASDKMRADAARERKEYVLTVNNALFKVDSQPAGAEVFVDGAPVGKTPVAGTPVPLGFHGVRVSAGGDFRDFEEVLEFSRDVEDRTGPRKIVLFKDYLSIGEREQKAGRVDAAIQAYGSVPKEHPDFSEARGRLAQLYLDEKGDYGAAIREFENVLSLPQNQQLIYKQYAVVFANLGHAYYEKGNAVVNRDREAASQDFAKAIQKLAVARQNMRFFPTTRYDEAVHDTFYYTALSYHKLYLLTKKGSHLDGANNAWRDYFDFFPEGLAGKGEFEQSRQAAKKYWDQIRDKL